MKLLIALPKLWLIVKKILFFELQIVTYERDSNTCAAFLINNHAKLPAVINYKGKDYHLPLRSISILPDCKTLVYNTYDVTSNSSPFKKEKRVQFKHKIQDV